MLVVDDDPEILNLVTDQLAGMGLLAEGILKISEGTDRGDRAKGNEEQVAIAGLKDDGLLDTNGSLRERYVLD